MVVILRSDSTFISDSQPAVVYIFALQTLKVTGVRSRTFDATAVTEYALNALPMVRGVPQWGKRVHDAHDYRIRIHVIEMSKLTRPCIEQLSQRVDDLWRH